MNISEAKQPEFNEPRLAINRVYTRRGDTGQTSLVGGQRVPKDSLRLEAGLCLHGNDIDPTTTPIEADLAWTIGKRRREEGGFPGHAIVMKQLKDGVSRKRVGIKPEDKAPARGHTPVADMAGATIGEITSGGFGPSVGGPIAMGYVALAHAQPGTPIQTIVRGTPRPARVVKMPFVQPNYHRG